MRNSLGFLKTSSSQRDEKILHDRTLAEILIFISKGDSPDKVGSELQPFRQRLSNLQREQEGGIEVKSSARVVLFSQPIHPMGSCPM
jgi:hypothetical protein